MMRILHLACIINTKYQGVSVVVPQHVLQQSKYAEICFANVNNIKIFDNALQYEFKNNFNIYDFIEKKWVPDLVIFHEVYRIQYVKIYKDLIKLNIPYVIVPHGELSKVAQKSKWIKKAVANALIFNSFIKKALFIQCLSEGEYNLIEKKNCKKEIFPNGIVLPENYRKHFNSDKIKFVYIGRLDIKIKGIDLMLQAILNIKQFLLLNRVQFNIYGPFLEGNANEIKRFISDNKLDDLVCLFDGVSGIEKEKVLLDSDIFIQTSRTEAMSMGLIEALAYSLPCCITIGTSFGDFVKENECGFVADTNIESIELMIRDAVVNKNAFCEMGHKGRTAINDRFSWNSVACFTIEGYKMLLNKK